MNGEQNSQQNTLMLAQENKLLRQRIQELEQHISDTTLSLPLLQQPSSLWYQLAQNLDDMIWVREQDIIQWISPSYESVARYSAALCYFTRGDITSLLHPDDRARVIAKVATFFPGLPPVELTYRIRQAHNTLCWIRERLFWAELTHSSTKLLVGVVRDITATKGQQIQTTVSLDATLYQAIVETQIEMICRFLPDGTLTFVNQAYCTFLQQPKEALIGANFFSFIPEHQHNQIKRCISLLNPNHTTQICEHQVFLPNVPITWKQWTNQAFFSPQGQLLEIQAVGRDVTAHKQIEAALRQAHDELDMHVQRRTAELFETNKAFQEEIMERKRAEESLRESEERYRTLVETLPGALLLTSLDGIIHFCNRQAALLFGYNSVEELYGKHGSELIAQEPYTDHLEYVQHIIESGKLKNIEYVMRKRDGMTFPAEVNSSLITDSQGYSTALIIVVQDISERKESEQAIVSAYQNLSDLTSHVTRNRNLLHAIVDGLEDGLLLLDKKGYVQTVNRALATLLGTTIEALIGQKWATVYPRISPEFPGDFALTSLAMLPDNQPHSHSMHHRYKDQDGNTHILNLHAIALQDMRHAVEQVIFHVVDVTEYVKLQTQVMENDRFATSGRLAASVAHEVNTPLQSLQLFVELAQVSPEEKRNTFLSYVQEEIQRIGHIVHNLLELYRPGAVAYGPLVISTLIERLLLLVGKQLMDQRIMVVRDLAEDLPLVWGRADEFMQVLLNLLVNALDAMPDGGTLTIRTRCMAREALSFLALPPAPLEPIEGQEGTDSLFQDEGQEMENNFKPEEFSPPPANEIANYVTIAIADNGCGINPDIQERIFDAFMTTKEQGTGLGLAISKQFIERFGGTITVQSAIQQGSTFTITLPVRTPESTLPETEGEIV
jgi:PAS domain S-box-containing protein